MENEKLKCPRCPNFALISQTFQGVTIHLCEKCGGVWLNKGELNAVVHPAEGDLEYCSTEHLDEDRLSDIKCPLCPASKMLKVNFIHYSDILLDYCPECHGLWLDRGELDAIVAEIEKLHSVPESWDHRVMVFISKLPF